MESYFKKEARIGVRLRAEVKEELELQARTNNKSLSELIRDVLEEYLVNNS